MFNKYIFDAWHILLENKSNFLNGWDQFGLYVLASILNNNLSISILWIMHINNLNYVNYPFLGLLVC